MLLCKPLGYLKLGQLVNSLGLVRYADIEVLDLGARACGGLSSSALSTCADLDLMSR